MRKVLIVGTGGLAREFTAWCAGECEVLGYSSVDRLEHGQYRLPGELFPEDASPQLVGTDEAYIAIGTPRLKEKICQDLRRRGFRFPSFVHPSSVVAGSARLAEGVIVAPNCVVAPDAVLGRLVYVNFCCGIGHDALVGDFAQLNPGVQLGGFARIGERVLIGSGAAVLQGVSVGADATVGSGAVVFGAVAAGATMMGNPARRMRALENTPSGGTG